MNTITLKFPLVYQLTRLLIPTLQNLNIQVHCVNQTDLPLKL